MSKCRFGTKLLCAPVVAGALLGCGGPSNIAELNTPPPGGFLSSTPESGALTDTEPRFVASGEPMIRPKPGAAVAARTSGINVFGELGAQQVAFTSTEPPPRFLQHTSPAEGNDTQVVLDSGGTRMLFSSTRTGGTSDLFVQPVSGGPAVQLTDHPADDAFGAFSPDGRQIAFASTRNGTWDLFLMNVDGTGVTSLTRGEGHEIQPSFSPDGTLLAYCAAPKQGGNWEIRLLNIQTGASRTITQGLFPRFSPTELRIVFQRARQVGSRRFSIWTVDLVNGEPTGLTEVAASSNAAIVSPAWSPCGNFVTFCTILQPEGGSGESRQDVWTCRLDGSDRQRVTDGASVAAAPWWGPDGRIYFVSKRGADSEAVWSAAVDVGSMLVNGPSPSDATPAVHTSTRERDE